MCDSYITALSRGEIMSNTTEIEVNRIPSKGFEPHLAIFGKAIQRYLSSEHITWPFLQSGNVRSYRGQIIIFISFHF